jgi:carbonic anhydrase/acetyltransferase-like protein (isoleucine patch superfamily)
LYICRTGATIAPFGDPVGQSQVMLETLAETQQRAARRFGLEPVFVDRPAEAAERPCLLTTDGVYFSERALGTFLREIRRRPGGAAAALARCVSVEHALPLQDVRLEDWDGPGARAVYDLWYVPEGPLPDSAAELRAALEPRCPPRILPMKERVIPLRLPTLFEEERILRYPLTSTVMVHVSHWTHLLWLAQLSLGVAGMEYFRAHRLRSIGKLLWAFLRRLSLNRYRLLSGLNVVGAGSRIHPTAYLEASLIGQNVQVGAGACVRNSLVGDGVIVGDHAVVLNSVVGGECYLTDRFFLASSLCYPGSTLGNVRTQMAVIGRDVYLHGWCGLLDAKFIGDIKVMHRGRMEGTGRSFLASCIGHRAVLGAKVLIHPGREIPNDLLLVSRPEDVIAEVPPDILPRTPMVRDQGTLVPLSSLKLPQRSDRGNA